MPWSILKDALIAVGILKSDNEPTPLTSLFSNLPSYHRILIAGLHDTGKSTLLQKHLAPNVEHIKTFTICIGCHFHVYRCGNVTFHVKDIGLSRSIGFHKMEMAFFNRADGVVWVVDANDCDAYPESREELIGKVNHKDGMTVDAPLLILANKQDPKDAEAVQKMESFFFDQESLALDTRQRVSLSKISISVS
jgi:GTPase SAR1 family protein